MFTRVWAVARKEFIQIVRDRRTLALVLVMPAIQLLMFGYAINTTVDHIPTVVYDPVQDSVSREFVAALQNSGYFDIRRASLDPLDVRQAVDRGDAKAGVVLSADFSRDIEAGRPAQVQLVIDGSDPNYAQTALFAAGSIALARGSDALARRLERLGVTVATGTAAIDLRPTVLYNPAMSSVVFMIPGLIGLILQFQTLLLTTFALVRERERGTLEQLLVSPIRPWELMAGKLLPYTILAFANVSVALLVGVLWFKVEYAGSLPLFFLLSLLFLVSSLGSGLFISTISETQGQATQAALFFQLPAIILSGFVFPREAMPQPLQDFGALVPLTYYLRSLRGIMVKGIGVESLWGDIWPLAVLGAGVFILSALRFRKQLA
jgi:ABC-2 type transport system permease protein